MSTSKLDAVYRSILLTRFFTKGWGKPENLRRLFEFRKVVSNRDECFKLVERDYPVTITKEQKLSDCHLIEGHFMSPLEKFLPGIVPEIAKKAHFQAVLPLSWPDPQCKPMCLHLAGTGDHFFWRRRNLMVKPLMKSGIGGIILENPFYGLRKPTDQVRSSLHNVSDIFVMGGCLILEALVLFHWCERNGLGPLGVTGLSMGGHMASLAATNWPKPLVLVPCLSWSTASAVFLQGVMSNSINWDLLEAQYLSDGVYREKLSKMVTIVDEAFLAGKKFAKTFSFIKDQQTDKQTATATGVNSEAIDKLEVTAKKVEAQNSNSRGTTQNILSKELLAELKRILDEGKIDVTLYEKLTSNESFELNAKDIEDINRLINGDKKDQLLKNNLDKLNLPPQLDIVKTLNGNDELSRKVLGSSANSDVKENIIVTDSAASKSKVNAVVNPDGAIVMENREVKAETKPEKKSWNVSDLTTDLWSNIPFLKSNNEKRIDITKIHWRDREALQFMRGVMDECTHLSNFSVPFDTSLIIAVCAKHDAYVPREDVGTLEEIWPGAEVRFVDAGHVSAYLLHQSLFRACIVEAFERSKKRWKDGKHVD